MKRAHLDRFATGGAVVVLTFEAERPLRVPVFTQLWVSSTRRDWALSEDTSGTPLIFEAECTT
ncbi:hypothetical protein F0344_21165 [Streptomyces finlayi]|uniref:Uncharacterized protein n=1 Tax=Streptomyces finlayi TaxID=67296 RepID=A0A7G7BN79_9ACTN|nr:hypothetical protein [Streptomyces finlayi]QNE76794.1 hypothetical protein F0344_21165 [Streptomyces finlayi]